MEGKVSTTGPPGKFPRAFLCLKPVFLSRLWVLRRQRPCTAHSFIQRLAQSRGLSNAHLCRFFLTLTGSWANLLVRLQAPSWAHVRTSASSHERHSINDSPASFWGFPGIARVKESARQRRRHKRCRFDPWIQKIPWRRKWQPTPIFLPGEPQGQRRLWTAVYGVTQSRTQLNTQLHLLTIRREDCPWPPVSQPLFSLPCRGASWTYRCVCGLGGSGDLGNRSSVA